MTALSSCVRAAVTAPPGYTLVQCDLANIEGRVAAWLAGEDWKLEAFRAFDAGTGPDLYKLAYARAFDMDPDDVDGEQRQIGKVMELALQYQGAVGAFNSMAGNYGVNLPDDAVKELVERWRESHPAIVEMWYALERAAIAAIETPGRVLKAGPLRVFAKHEKGKLWLLIKLPSGRFLVYPDPEVREEMAPWGKMTKKASYMGVNQFTRKWERIDNYGGKTFENIVQAMARDCLAHGMWAMHNAGHQLVFTVHDEVVIEVPESQATEALELVEMFMTTVPDWAEGLPLAAEGKVGKRYGK